MMTVHTDQADQKFKHIRMSCSSSAQLPMDVDGIDSSIDTQILKNNIILVHLATLENRRNPDIGALKKNRGDIFSEFCTTRFKAKFLCYINEVLFEMVKIALKDEYFGGTTPTELQNEVSTCQKTLL